MSRFKFPLGRLLATPAAIKVVEEAGIDLFSLVVRHGSGDWGEVCREDAEENERSVRNGWRILSAYAVRHEAKVWILTEADRSCTTILLPEEY